MALRKNVAVALFAACAIAVNVAESYIPLPMPGMKLGAANVFALAALVLYGAREAYAVTFLRVLLAWLLTGNTFALLCGGPGAFLSVTAMSLLHVKFKDSFSLPSISVVGAWAFNIAQTAAAALLIGNRAVLWYALPLLIAGTAAGFAVGVLASAVCKRLAAAFPGLMRG